MSETGGDSLLTRVAPSPDQPLGQNGKDLLRREGFARALAAQISAAGDSGLVMALTGPWGSGKTSLLNMIERDLVANRHVTVVRFNPWYFSGTDQLIQHFFTELAAQLGDSETWKEIGLGLKRYAALLAPLSFVPGMDIASKSLTAVGAALSEDKSLHEQRATLTNKLADAPAQIVVMIDDVDRLEAEEIRQLVKLVRLVGDFPRMLYLLAYDEEPVSSALGEREAGRRYLEKIVQLSYQVPEIRSDGLGEMLGDETARVLGGEEIDEERRALLVERVLDPLMDTVRDVRRYVNVLPFALELVGGEVDELDVLALEALRLFVPDMFAFLPDVADWL